MKNRALLWTMLCCLLGSGLFVVSAQETLLQTLKADVETMPASEEDTPQVITEGGATLYTDANGATMTFVTADLEPEHVYSAWWVIMNNSEACTSVPCSAADVIGNAEGVGTQITFADSLIVGEDGSATFAGHLPAGEVENGWYDQNFDDPTTAEIHIVINDHGPLIEDLAMSMLTSYRGGCSDDSIPPPFPETAKLDGEAGPNACVLVQDAIFVQS